MIYLTNVIDRYHRGWLKPFSDNNLFFLPYLTRAERIEFNINYEKIKIIEGNFKDYIIKVPYLIKNKRYFYSYFTDEKIEFKKNIIFLNKKNKTMILGKKIYKVEINYDFKKGDYLIDFPIRKNFLNKKYLDENKNGSRFADSWFPLIRKDEFNTFRFLHYGIFSKGCVSFRFDANKGKDWSYIFIKLMNSRILINDNYYLAKMVVF